jgi:hypothetical protein
LETMILQSLCFFTFQTVPTHEARNSVDSFTSVFENGLRMSGNDSMQGEELSAERDYLHAQTLLLAIITCLQEEKPQSINAADQPTQSSLPDTSTMIENIAEKIIQMLLTQQPFLHQPNILTTTLPPSPLEESTPPTNTSEEDKAEEEILAEDIAITLSTEEMNRAEEEKAETEQDFPVDTSTLTHPSNPLKIKVEEAGYFDYHDIYPQETQTDLISPVSESTTLAYDDTKKSSNACCIVQ